MKFNLVKCLYVTQMMKAHYQNCKDIVEDPEKEKRLKQQLCNICYYGSRVGGAMITSKACESCGKEQTFSNTNTDILCQECAKNMGVCKHCGSDMNYKNRRKL